MAEPNSDCRIFGSHILPEMCRYILKIRIHVDKSIGTFKGRSSYINIVLDLDLPPPTESSP